MEDARRDILGRGIGRGNAEDVGVGDRLARRARSPATSRITPPSPVFDPPYGSMAEGWLWVSTLKQTSNSSSNRTTPALSAKTLTSQSRLEVLRRLEDRLLEEVVDDLALELDPAAERLVRAVLAPGLGDRLQLAVGRLAAEPAKWAWIVFISARLRESWPDRLSSMSSSSSFPVSGPRCDGTGTVCPCPSRSKGRRPMTACSTASLASTRRMSGARPSAGPSS